MELPARTLAYRRLEESLVLVEKPTTRPRGRVIGTGLAEMDASLPGQGLERGKVHEWLGVAACADQNREKSDEKRALRRPENVWTPPLTILVHLAQRVLGSDAGHRVAWIGPHVWPYPASLVRRGEPAISLFERCLFVRAASPADRLWATDLALRSGACAAVVADGSGFDLTATRRLQLGAEAGKSLCLLARRACEAGVLSAAATRWLVSGVSSPSERRWTVELLRCKGLQPSARAPRAWVLERDHATCALRLAAGAINRPGETENPAEHPAVRRTG